MSKIASSRGAASPTPTSLSSSFDLLSRPDSDVISQRRWADSDDEIVWGERYNGSPSSSDDGSSVVSDSDNNDFMVLSRPRSPGDVLASAGFGDLVPGLEALSLRNDGRTVVQRGARRPRRKPENQLSEGKGTTNGQRNNQTTEETKAQKEQSKEEGRKGPRSPRRKGGKMVRVQRKLASDSLRSNPTTPALPDQQYVASLKTSPPRIAPAPHGGRARPRPAAVDAPPPPGTAFTTRSIVDDCSEAGDLVVVSPVYEEAVTYVSSFLSNPSNSSHSRLALLQSLIVELGLCSPTDISLPGSMTAARALIKARAFLNIREYLAVRNQGQDAVKRVMHPSRSALIRDLRRKRNPAPLPAVKKSGLNVLLVSCF